jgi:LacI family transcriptional regulator
MLMWGDLTPESGCVAAEKLLEQESRPTAILAGNDMMAFGAIYAARQMGLRIPQDLAVVGFDDVQLSAFFHPGLTTVEIPRYQMGLGAMEMLIDLIAGNRFDRMRWFKTRLVVRDSSGDHRPHGDI